MHTDGVAPEARNVQVGCVDDRRLRRSVNVDEARRNTREGVDDLLLRRADQDLRRLPTA